MRLIVFGLSLILIFMIPWEGVSRLPGFGNMAKLFGIAVAGFWLVKVSIAGRLRKPVAFHLLAGLFVLWNAISIFWSADISRTEEHLITLIQLLALVFIVWDLYTSRAALLAGLQAYVLGAYVAIASTVFNYLSGNVFYTNYLRYSSGDTNPDGFAFIVALGIPVAWYLAGTKTTIKIRPVLKIVNYAYIPAAFMGLALSGTRTAFIASVPGMIYGLASFYQLRQDQSESVIRRGPWSRIAVFVFLASVLLILLPQAQTLKSFQRLSTILPELTAGDLNQRTYLWGEGITSFTQHPFVGVGGNMYRSVNSLGKVAHNTFLSILVELGLIGFLLFGLVVTIAVLKAFSLPKWDKRFWLTLLTVWAIGAFTLTWEDRKTTWLFLCLLMANATLPGEREDSVPTVPLVREQEPERSVLPEI